MHYKKGLDPLIGEHLEGLLHTTGAFKGIDAKKLELVLSTNQEAAGPLLTTPRNALLTVPPATGSTPEVRALSNALRTTITIIMERGIGQDLQTAGVDEELRQGWLRERNDPTFQTLHDFWFVTARKCSA